MKNQNMEYSEYLFSCLLKLKYPQFQAPYDIEFGLVKEIYSQFNESLYNDPNLGEYECINRFLDECDLTPQLVEHFEEPISNDLPNLKINSIDEPTTQLFYKDKLIGTIDNSLSLNDVLIQIKQQQLEGCYFKFIQNNTVHLIRISKDGNILNRINGFFNTYANQVRELI